MSFKRTFIPGIGWVVTTPRGTAPLASIMPTSGLPDDADGSDGDYAVDFIGGAAVYYSKAAGTWSGPFALSLSGSVADDAGLHLAQRSFLPPPPPPASSSVAGPPGPATAPDDASIHLAQRTFLPPAPAPVSTAAPAPATPSDDASLLLAGRAFRPAPTPGATGPSGTATPDDSSLVLAQRVMSIYRPPPLPPQADSQSLLATQIFGG